MSFSMNICTVGGNLTRDVEITTTPGGTVIGKVGIAINERRKKGDEWVPVTHFVDITMFSGVAERAAKFLKKGAAAVFTGRLQMDSWEDKNTGAKRTKLFLLANEVTFLPGQWGKDLEGGGRERDMPSEEAPF